MKKYLKYFVLLIILLFFFSLIPLTGDDWGKGAGGLGAAIEDGVSLWKSYNGRFLGNILVVLLKGNFILKVLLQSIVVSLIIAFLSEYEKSRNVNNFFLVMILMFGMSIWMFRESILWLSGFVNFAIPPLCIAGYLYITKNIFDKTKEVKGSSSIIFLSFIFGLFMNTFSEHSAIFSVILGVGTILISILTRRKIYSVSIAFLLGAIIGFVLMFSSPAYWNEMPRLAGLEFNNYNFFEKIEYNLKYSSWLKDMIFKNLILNVIISGIFLLNIFKYNKLLPKLVTLFLVTLTLLVFPMIIINRFHILTSYTVQISVAILYVISIIYLLFHMFYKTDNIKLVKFLYLFLTSFIAASPLLLAFGIGPRCFLNSYILLILFVITLSNELVDKFNKTFNILLMIGSVIILFSLNFMAYQNHKTTKHIMEIAKESNENKYLYLEMPKYPYYFMIHQGGTPLASTGYHYEVFKLHYNLDPRSYINFISYKQFIKNKKEGNGDFNNFIEIPTYDGSNQPTHPSVLYFEKPINGYQFWMSYTPWPNNNNSLENPSIVASKDGFNWIVPENLTNPVSGFPDENSNDYYSDPNLIYVNDKFELWYRHNPYDYNDEKSNVENNIIMRKTSDNGVDWSTSEIIFDDEKNQAYMSISVIHENNQYKVWYINYDAEVYYRESNDLKSWTSPKKIEFKNYNELVWHGEVRKNKSSYEFIFINNTTRELEYATSTDGIEFKINKNINLKINHENYNLKTRVYKSSFVIVEDKVYLYVPINYIGTNSKWQMYLSVFDKNKFKN